MRASSRKIPASTTNPLAVSSPGEARAKAGNGYRHPALKRLREDVRYVPVKVRVEQVDRAEALLSEIAAEKRYPYE